MRTTRWAWIVETLMAGVVLTAPAPGGAVVTPRGGPVAGFYTPIRWQETVSPLVNRKLAGQIKNTTWIRDKNRNFIDDLIDSTFAQGDTVDVAVDLNAALPVAAVDSLFRGFGSIGYVGRIMTALLLNRVPVRQLDSLASMPNVAMVEWQAPIYPAVVYSTREILSRTVTSVIVPGYASSAESRGEFGQGIPIAILDTGVDETNAGIPTPLSGFDATKFSDLHNANDPNPLSVTDPNGIDDSCEPPPVGDGDCTGPDDAPNDGSVDPAPCPNPNPSGTAPCGHATHVAGVALARGLASPCVMIPSTKPPEEGALTSNYCSGTARGAELVDIRVCTDNATPCAWQSVLYGLDWMITRPASQRARVANLSFEQCGDNDGSGLVNAMVDYAVASGITVVAANGNFGKCPGTSRQQSLAPASAPGSIAVAAVDDNDTILRNDDTIYTDYLEGPRPGFDPTVIPIDYSALKPDVSAPGVAVYAPKQGSQYYESTEGTSIAAPHVSGVAAILIRAIEASLTPPQHVNPGSIADLIRNTADPPDAMKPTYGTTDIPVWNRQFGMGIVNVGRALDLRENGPLADVSFPHCDAPNTPGSPCLLAAPRASWENDLDIRLQDDPPVPQKDNVIITSVRNSDPQNAAVVMVNFGTYVFGTGGKQFYPIGRQRVPVPAASTVDVRQPWTPRSESHQCIQVSIDYGLDAQFWNNITQRNILLLPATSPAGAGNAGAPTGTETPMRVENPFFRPADFRIVAKGSRADWPCYATPSSFHNDPARDPPAEIEVGVDARRDASPGAKGGCQFRVFGTPVDTHREEEIGGVTLLAYVPERCSARAIVVDTAGRPLRDVTVLYGRAILPSGVRWEQVAQKGSSGRVGTFRATFETGVPYRFRLSSKGLPDREIVIAPRCGSETLRLVYESGAAAR